MSRSLSADNRNSQPLGNTSARLVAVKLKSANKNIFKSLLSLGSANLLTRIMGLLSQTIITARFGQGTAMDAYFAASTLPITLADIMGSSIEASVIPVYARLRTKGNRDRASILFSTLLNILIVASLLFALLMFLFRQPLIIFFAPTKNSLLLQTAITLAPYATPVFFFRMINSYLEDILNAEGQFGWPAYAGMLSPITTSAFAFVGGVKYGVEMLFVGAIVGLILQLMLIIYRAHGAKIKYRPALALGMPEIRMTARAALPALFGGLIGMASPLVDQMFTTPLPQAGSLSALSYATKLNAVPTGVIFSSVGRAALPYLAAQAAIKDMKSFKETLRLYLWAVTIGALVVMLGMIVLAHPVIEILWQHGNFTEQNTNTTALTLIGLTLGLPATAAGWILARAFSALGKTRVLMFISTFSVLANAGFDALFAHFWGLFGITLATSAVYTCTMIILIIALSLTIGNLNLFTPPRELLGVLWKIGIGEWIAILKEEGMAAFVLPYEYRKMLNRFFLALVIFVAGVAGVITNSLITLAVAFGSTAVLVLLRYRYLLLVCWVMLDVFIGSNVTVLAGGHFLSGLTFPTLLLLFYLPVKMVFKRMPALVFWLVYFLWILLSVGISPMTLYDFFTQWTQLMDYIGIAVLTIVVINSRKRLLALIDIIMLPAIFVTIYGLIGYATKQHGVIDPTTQYFRISSVFGNTPPTLALYLSVIIPLLVYRLSSLRGWKLVFGLGLLVLLLANLVLTFDRGSEITLPLSTLAIVPFLPSKKMKAMVVSLFAALGGAVLLIADVLNINILGRFSNTDLTSLNGRTLLWQAILDHFNPTVLMGYGHKASDQLLLNLRVGFKGGVIATVAHNIYLENMYDHGLIGLTLLVLAIISLGVGLLRRMRNSSSDLRLLLCMATLSFLAVFGQSFESNDIWNQGVGMYFFILMALPFANYWFNEKATVETETHADKMQEGTETREKTEQEQLAPVL